MNKLLNPTVRGATRNRLVIEGQKLRQILSKHGHRLSKEAKAGLTEALDANREALDAIDAVYDYLRSAPIREGASC